MLKSTTIRRARRIVLTALAITLCGNRAFAATVVATSHYQAESALTCNLSLTCTTDFPAPGNKHRVIVDNVSCWVLTNSASVYLSTIQLWAADNTRLLSQFLPTVAPPVGENQLLNQSVDMQVGANQHVHIEIKGTGQNFVGADCSVAGTLETLQ